MDASFAIYLTAAASGPRAAPAVGDFSQRGLQAPILFWHEVASGLRGMMLRREVTQTRRTESIRGLRTLGIKLDSAPPWIEQIIAVSEQYQLTIYDAAYLELAIRVGGDLATRDGGLIKAGPKAGVGVVTALD